MSEAETEKRSRRERRAEAKGAQPDEIKDKNQRLRAEAIARRKTERKRELSSARSEGLATAERVDDALVRSADTAGRLLKQNFKWMQWVIVLGIAGSMAYLVYDYRREVEREEQGHSLGEALATIHGRIATATPVSPSDRNLVDTRPEFDSTGKLLEASLGRFTELSRSGEPELRLLGQLGRAGVLYDQEKFAEARSAYEEGFKSPVSARFPELRIRAAEGVALCHEAEGRLEDAAKAVRVLGDLGGPAADLAALHGARIDYEKGDVQKAKDALVKLLEKLGKKRSLDTPPGYVEAAARELQKTVDPTGAAAAAAGAGISPEQLEALRKQFEAMQGAPAAPAPQDVAPLEVPPVGLPGSELDDPLEAQSTPTPSTPTPSTPASVPAAPLPKKAVPASPKPTPAATGALPKTATAPPASGASPAPIAATPVAPVAPAAPEVPAGAPE